MLYLLLRWKPTYTPMSFYAKNIGLTFQWILPRSCGLIDLKKNISKTASNDDVWSLSDIFFSNKIQETILFLTIWTFSNQWEEDVCSTYRNLFSAWVWKVLTTRFLVMRYIGAPAKTTHTSGAGRRSLSLSYLEKIRKKAV